MRNIFIKDDFLEKITHFLLRVRKNNHRGRHPTILPKSVANHLPVLREDVAHHLLGHGSQFRRDPVQGFRLARSGAQGEGQGFQEAGVRGLCHQFGQG